MLVAKVALNILSVAAIRHGFFDLSVYYGAVQYWAEGHDIYGYVRQHAEYGFTYPPFAALTMLPMAFVGWQVAVLVSVVLSLLATGVVLYWMVDPIARRQGWSWQDIADALEVSKQAVHKKHAGRRSAHGQREA